MGDTLILLGRNFGGDLPRVLLGAVDATAQVMARTEDRMEVTLPDDPLLQPGIQGVQVLRDVPMGEPPVPHRGLRSNLAVFVLTPRITSTSPPSGPAGTTLVVQGTRLYQEGRPNVVLVGDTPFVPTNPPPPAPPAQSPTQVQVPVSGLPPGTYHVRVRVNGTESLEETPTFEVTP